MTPSEYEENVAQIRRNLEDVKRRMKEAAEKSGREVNEIQLIAVTKLMPLEMVRAGIEAGIRNFGENYPEQAAEKMIALSDHEDIRWHMIGHIQSRKTGIVCDHFHIVHSLDRMKIARYLDRYSRERKKVMPVLIEVNLSGEKSKHGFQADNKDSWDELAVLFREIGDLENIEICGLMTMPPLFDDPEKTRPVYQRLRELQQFLQNNLPEMDWDDLSIGTSFDFTIAIEEGATMVRLGTELFGQRPG